MDEILHQVVDSLSHYLQGFRHTRWLFEISSINSRNEDPDYVSYFNEVFADLEILQAGDYQWSHVSARVCLLWRSLWFACCAMTARE